MLLIIINIFVIIACFRLPPSLFLLTPWYICRYLLLTILLLGSYVMSRWWLPLGPWPLLSWPGTTRTTCPCAAAPATGTTTPPTFVRRICTNKTAELCIVERALPGEAGKNVVILRSFKRIVQQDLTWVTSYINGYFFSSCPTVIFSPYFYSAAILNDH